jgi:hypothetical protein
MKRARATIAARIVVGRGQLQADDVVEHVRRGVDLDVHRAPERDPHRGVVGNVGVHVRHDAPSDVGV